MTQSTTRNLHRRVLARSARVLTTLSLIAALSGAGAAYALADSGNTSAVAVNTQDGSSVFKLTLAIDKVAGSAVTNQNAAVAYSSCTACQTVAISIQVLLISGSPTIFTPTNLAIAINQNCTLCDTLAAAYQFAVGVDTQLRFTADGRQQIADIRQQLEQLRKSGLSGPQIAAQVDTLMTQLSNVLQTQLVGITPGPDSNAGSGNQGSATPTSTNPTNPTSTSTNPTSTPTSPTNPTSTSTTPTAPGTTSAPTTSTGTTPTSTTQTPTTTTSSPGASTTTTGP